ncbi:MAG: ABC transporter ATP-binding protein/permease [Candidatus Omnitrophica bacterium]|nr:ABC transporter ATP-binding protein/permease [Candidatus Omnitrophota bacterium]
MRDYVRLFSFAKRYYGYLFLAGICMFLVSTLDVFRLSTIVPIVDRVFSNKQIITTQKSIPLFLIKLFDYLNSLSALEVLRLLLIVVPLALIVRGIFEFLQGYIIASVGQKVVRDIRDRLFEKIQGLSLDYFIEKRKGELISRIVNDAGLIENAITHGLTDFFYEGFQIVFFSIVIFIINWRLALMGILIFPLIAIPMVNVGRKLRKLSRSSQEKIADINSLLVESFLGAKIVKAFLAEEREIEKFKKNNQAYYKLIMKRIKRSLVLSIGTELIGVFIGIMILYYSGKQVIEGRMSFGIFGLFLGSLLSMIRPIKKLSQLHAIIHQALGVSNRIYELLDVVPTVKENIYAKELKEFKEDIVFENVCFSYDGTEVLKNINLKVKKGEILAIVGLSGAGKTTLVDLIPRFYDPCEGRILIDGEDIRNFTLRSLRRNIGLVTQETVLFNDTIKNNIAYADPSASLDKIIESAKKAYAHDFIQKLPLGYETRVGDLGAKLSGGERQRIAIARAFLKNPSILILDEATSQLDSESEKMVQKALEVLMQGRTVFLITHRLSMVLGAWRIIVLDKGEVVEEGTHQELIMKKEGLYRKLFNLQMLA